MFENDNTKQDYSNNNTSEKTRKTNWLPWILVAVMGALLALQYLGNSGTTVSTVLFSNGFNWLPLLAGLACPLMMLFMMSGHSHGTNHSSGNDQDNQNGSSGRGGCCGGHQTK